VGEYAIDAPSNCCEGFCSGIGLLDTFDLGQEQTVNCILVAYPKGGLQGEYLGMHEV
jgi:hypothetical protein